MLRRMVTAAVLVVLTLTTISWGLGDGLGARTSEAGPIPSNIAFAPVVLEPDDGEQPEIPRALSSRRPPSLPVPSPAAPAPTTGRRAPVPAPAPLPLPGVRIGDLLWVGDMETGDFSQFDDTPWNQVGSPDPEIVSDRVRDGKRALAVTIPPGGNRNELVPDIPKLTEGDELYFGFSTYLAPGFPVDAGWQVLAQWKNDGTGSPPVSLKVENGQFLVHGGYGHPSGNREFRVPIGPAKAGVWDDWVWHIRFSDTPSKGFVEVWRNGEVAVERFSPDSGTLYPGLDSYLKIGYYRNPGIDTEGTVYIDNWRIGSSLG